MRRVWVTWDRQVTVCFYGNTQVFHSCPYKYTFHKKKYTKLTETDLI